MVAWELVHITHAFACQLRYQAQDPAWRPYFLFFTSPSLHRGLALIDRCIDLWRVGVIQPLVLTMLQAMRMVERQDTPHEV